MAEFPRQDLQRLFVRDDPNFSSFGMELRIWMLCTQTQYRRGRVVLKLRWHVNSGKSGQFDTPPRSPYASFKIPLVSRLVNKW